MRILLQTSEALALEVSCSDDELTVVLDDGRTVSAPLAWFPRLLKASGVQRKRWELIGGGIGVHWEEIDEDISVASLLNPERFMRAAPVNNRPPVRSAISKPTASARKRSARVRS